MGKFLSPVALSLPEQENIKYAHFQLVVPASGGFEAAVEKRAYLGDLRSPKYTILTLNLRLLIDFVGMPFVIHLPATGDEGFGRRRELFAKPLLKRGIASIILQIPFYGKRRMPGQKGAGLLKIEHSAQQSLGAVVEALALAAWLRDTKGHKGHIGLTGISYGGAMAALAGCYSDAHTAIVSMVPSDGPALPFLDGALARTVSFKSFENGREEVSALLHSMNVPNVALRLTKSAVARTYIQLTAMHDKYIPAVSADNLYKAMSQIDNAESELREMEGGHVAAFVFRAKPYVQAIDDAFASLSRQLDAKL